MKQFEKFYIEHGAYHHRVKGFVRWWTRDNYRILAAWVGDSERTLDLACGDGAFWAFLKTSAVVGADHAAAGLKFARTFASYPLVRADMRALPFKKGSFETVVCSLSFQYLYRPDLERCLGDLSGILVRGGKLVLSYPNVLPAAAGVDAPAAIPYDEFLACLIEAKFRPVATKVISLRIPERLFRWSTRPGLNAVSLGYYQISKLARRDPRRSYHYALCCLNGDGLGIEAKV